MACSRLILVAVIQLALVLVTSGNIHVTLQQPVTRFPSLTPSSETQACVTEVDPKVFPKCKILFREEGGWPHTFNATCVKPNVFLVEYDRPVSEKITRTSDQILFSSLYGEKPPPYSRIICSAPFPIDFEYQGPGVLDFLRIWKSIKYPESNATETGTTYNINAEILLTPDATGKYAIHSIEQPNILTSFFIFSSKPERPYILGADTEKPLEAQESGTNFILPCITTNYNVTLALFKKLPGTNRWMLYNGDKIYDPEEGYSLPATSTKPGDSFKCSTGVADDEDSVVVNIPAHTTPSETVQKASKLKIDISESGGSAVCKATDGQHSGDMKFYNVYVRNPTESHLIADCLLKGRPNCGGHTYHDRKEGRVLENPLCKNTTSCNVITSLHREGLLVCITGSDSVSLDYFTGLDNKIYKDWNLAPRNALIRPRHTPNTTNEFTTGTKYEFKCESVGFLFVKDPYVMTVHYKNGTLEKLADLVWWHSGKEFYLTSEMDQIICSDELWSTHEVINSSVQVNVTVKKCLEDQFTCHNGQCIRDSWRCDGDKDCTDASDEESCLTHVCRTGHFKCQGGQCITNEKTCNNKRECPGSDESHATCFNKTCNADDFKCNAGQCIPAHFLCDGDKDCIDESDEAPESCSKFYPQITGVPKVTFSENSLNELVCETNTLPAKLAPRLEWWFQDKNITDQHRLWKDLTGSKLALRFPNVSVADQGIYTCFAQNMLISVKQTFTVEVKQHDISCRSELPKSECLRRGCAFDSASKSCHDFVEFVEPGTTTTTRPSPVTPTPTLRKVVIPSSTTTTAKPTVKPGKDDVVIPGKLHIHEPIAKTEEETEESGHALEWTFGILTFLVLSVLVAGLVWRYYYSRHVPAGSARMRDDDQVTLNGI